MNERLMPQHRMPCLEMAYESLGSGPSHDFSRLGPEMSLFCPCRLGRCRRNVKHERLATRVFAFASRQRSRLGLEAFQGFIYLGLLCPLPLSASSTGLHGKGAD